MVLLINRDCFVPRNDESLFGGNCIAVEEHSRISNSTNRKSGNAITAQQCVIANEVNSVLLCGKDFKHGVARSVFHGVIWSLIILFLLCSLDVAAQTTVFSKKETLYSTKNGSPIGDLLLSIEPKSVNANNNEWVLIIGDRGNNFFESRNERTLWIFNKKVKATDFRRDMRSRDYPVEIKDLSDFMPFCENGIRFDLKDWEELRKQTQVSFFINASPGQKVTLRLVFYASSQDSRRRTTIDDEAKVRIDFE
ncbi:MAG: hypothetical protein LBE79_12385, partial [Tannerella sp.]|nr:hypothetical protein [Tannerella sp.]